MEIQKVDNLLSESRSRFETSSRLGDVTADELDWCSSPLLEASNYITESANIHSTQISAVIEIHRTLIDARCLFASELGDLDRIPAVCRVNLYNTEESTSVVLERLGKSIPALNELDDKVVQRYFDGDKSEVIDEIEYFQTILGKAEEIPDILTNQRIDGMVSDSLTNTQQPSTTYVVPDSQSKSKNGLIIGAVVALVGVALSMTGIGFLIGVPLVLAGLWLMFPRFFNFIALALLVFVIINFLI